jgi:rod shape-determining protein MreC
MGTTRDDFVIAIRSAFLKKGTQQRFSLLSLILFSIVFLVLGNFNFKAINFSRILIKEVIYFSSFIVTVPENIIKKSFNKASDHFEHYDNYQIIHSELQELKSKDLSKKIITFENVELKKLIEDYFVEDSQVYAKVLIDKESPFLRSIIINKGSKNDIKIGMIAYDDKYLIGKVVEVNYLSSRVLLISDINSKVPVTVQPLNIQAIMEGLNKQQGRLQYVKGGKIKNNDNEELIIVTSGSGGLFKSGIPIGKINQKNILNNNEIIVDFYRDFSQLKYIKILSHIKKKKNIDQSNKNIFKESNSQITRLKNQAEDIKVLIQQKNINNEIKLKLQSENIRLKNNLINAQKELKESNKKIKEDQGKQENLKFLELNLLHGHKCRKSLFKSQLFQVGTDEYRDCVFKKAAIKKTR